MRKDIIFYNSVVIFALKFITLAIFRSYSKFQLSQVRLEMGGPAPGTSTRTALSYWACAAAPQLKEVLVRGQTDVAILQLKQHENHSTQRV